MATDFEKILTDLTSKFTFNSNPSAQSKKSDDPTGSEIPILDEMKIRMDKKIDKDLKIDKDNKAPNQSTFPMPEFDRENCPLDNNMRKVEGYWADPKYKTKDCAAYPVPKPNAQSFEGEKQFIEKLNKIELSLQKPPHISENNGHSYCRICEDFEYNGSREYHFKGYNWPGGYTHYIQQHHVKPSREFYLFVMKMTDKIDLTPLPQTNPTTVWNEWCLEDNQSKIANRKSEEIGKDNLKKK